jgi:PIN domain nuclease of toxin-antitoxin system
VKILLDTHFLLWAAGEPARLPAQARTLIESPSNEPMFSVASIWEIVIKRGLNRADFRVEPHLLRRGLLDNGYTEIMLTSDHALAVSALPLLHKDPFDRILVAQAQVENVLLLTGDPILADYPGPIRRF